MDIFISWSGERSRVVAEALADWLPQILNAAKPFVSSKDIDKGTRWAQNLSRKLETGFGIVCLTPSNLSSTWVHFEAGALSKAMDDSRVWTYLIGVDNSDLRQPLAQFQATRADKADTVKMVQAINGLLGSDARTDWHLLEALDMWWPKLEKTLNTLPEESSSPNVPKRTAEDMFGEILELLRSQSRNTKGHSALPQRFQFPPTETQLAVVDHICKAILHENPMALIGIPSRDPRTGALEVGFVTPASGPVDISVEISEPLEHIASVVKNAYASAVKRESGAKSPSKTETRMPAAGWPTE